MYITSVFGTAQTAAGTELNTDTPVRVQFCVGGIDITVVQSV